MNGMVWATDIKRDCWAWVLPMLGLAFSLWYQPDVALAQWATSGNNIYNTNTGNVGIGTTAPDGKLHVNAGRLVVTPVTGDVGQIRLDDSGIVNPWYALNSGGTFSLRNSLVDRLAITTSGNVGIGTTNPSQKLHVVGNAQIDGVALPFLTLSGTESGAGTIGIQENGGRFQFNVAGTGRMFIDTSGNIGIGTTSPGAKLDVSGDININRSDAFTGYSAGLNVNNVPIAGTTVLRVHGAAIFSTLNSGPVVTEYQTAIENRIISNRTASDGAIPSAIGLNSLIQNRSTGTITTDLRINNRNVFCFVIFWGHETSRQSEAA